LFDLFAGSYKRFKERFVKVIIRPEATAIFFYESGGSRFPLYWTREPCGFKEWPRPTEGADELEILSLFDALPGRLPCRMLIGAYAKPGRWAAVRGMGLSLRSVGQSIFIVRSFLTFVFSFAETMVNERPNAVSVLDKHRQKAAKRKGRRSLEVMPPADEVVAKSREQAGPSQKSKKRPREGSNIATTVRSPGSMPTPPPPRREMVEVVQPSPRPRPGSSDAGGRPGPSPFDLLGRGHQFTRRVRVALPDESRESLREVAPAELMRSDLELVCRSVVLFQHGLQAQDRHVETVSQLEHKLSEATQSLEQSLAANVELSTKIAKESAERELAQNEAVEARRQLEAEKKRAAAEVAQLKKWADGKLAESAAEVLALQTAKAKVEAELDENYDEAEELLKQCFERAVHQVHVLYGGPPAAGEFDLDCEVYQGWIMPSAEEAALTARGVEPAGTEGGEAEVQGREAEAEEGECIEVQD